MRAKLILPALAESKSPIWRPIKYSLFPPIGLATLAGFFDDGDELTIVDQHVEELSLDDSPDLVLIQVYITNAYRAYRIADSYRERGSFVALGGLHVTALPEEARAHADAIFLGPAEESFPRFLADFHAGNPLKEYRSTRRSLDSLSMPRRDLIRREKYLAPNSLVVSRGCPHHCDFCYKDSFYLGGKSFYTRRVDAALEEIDSLPGRHLFFLDDHLFGSEAFARELFGAMLGMGRIFQAAATVDSILGSDLVELAAKAGLRSLFVGFETFSDENLASSNKLHNRKRSYEEAARKLRSLGIQINGSFIFGMDGDDRDVFKRTVEWGIENAVTTATYHILTPYPGTRLFEELRAQGRIVSYDWDRYGTRDVVFRPKNFSAEDLAEGYAWAYEHFYKWSSILKSSLNHEAAGEAARHLAYAAGWKKMEPLWTVLINLGFLRRATPLLESVLGRGGAIPQARSKGVSVAGSFSRS